MPFDVVDYKYLSQALDLATQGLYTAKPNPVVGCLFVKNNKIIAKGWHKQAGRDHAEIVGLKNCDFEAKGATCYVTLEPCFHYGKTPPCVDALIKAKVARVVIISLDSNKLVSGKSIKKLLEHNIQVDILDALDKNTQEGLNLINRAQEMNKGFIKRMNHNMPWVISKIAISMDGKIALKNGYSKWITSEKSRIDVHHLRAQMSAIITTSKTVLQDDARLNPRINLNTDKKLDSEHWPLRVVLDKDLKTNLSNNIYNLPGKVIVFTDKQNIIKSKQDKIQSFLNKDIKVYDSLELKLLLIFLAKDYQCNTVLFEAGSILNAKLLEKRLINELIIYKSPKILGQDGISMFNINNITEQQLAMDFNSSLVNNLNYFKLHGAQAIDNDVKLTYRL
tara:strand:- start:15011 stop:16186 length:1176 start_codon:yes stop_codon:yes gene_type:complete